MTRKAAGKSCISAFVKAQFLMFMVNFKFWFTWKIDSNIVITKIFAPVSINAFNVRHHFTVLTCWTKTLMQVLGLATQNVVSYLVRWSNKKSVTPSHCSSCMVGF